MTRGFPELRPGFPASSGEHLQLDPTAQRRQHALLGHVLTPVRNPVQFRAAAPSPLPPPQTQAGSVGPTLTHAPR